jgi:hypothetical protein
LLSLAAALAEEHAMHFGQTPQQLFTAPHPPRLPAYQCGLPLFHELLHPTTVTRTAHGLNTNALLPPPPAIDVGNSSVVFPEMTTSVDGFKPSTPIAASLLTPPSSVDPMATPVVVVQVSSSNAHLVSIAELDTFDDSEPDSETDGTSMATPKPPRSSTPEHQARSSSAGGSVTGSITAPPARSGFGWFGKVVAPPPLPPKDAPVRNPMDVRPLLSTFPAIVHKGAPYAVHVEHVLEHVVVIYEDGSFAPHKFEPFVPSSGLPFTFKPGKRKPMVHPRLASNGVRSISAQLPPETVGFSGNITAILAPLGKRATVNDAVIISVGAVDGGIRWQCVDGKRFGVGVPPLLPLPLFYCYCLLKQTYLPSCEGLGHATTVVTLCDGRSFVTGHSDGSAQLWEVVSRAFLVPVCCKTLMIRGV